MFLVNRVPTSKIDNFKFVLQQFASIIGAINSQQVNVNIRY